MPSSTLKLISKLLRKRCHSPAYWLDIRARKPQLSTATWFQMNNLIGVAKFHNLVVVPNRGLFSFGGTYNPLTNAQRLPTIAGTWELGPYLYKQQALNGECVVQVIHFKSS